MPPSESASVVGSRTASCSVPGADAGPTVVWLRGEQDITTRDSLVADITRVAGHYGTDIVVDMSQVTFMDASTVGAIVGSRNRLRLHFRRLHVRAPSRWARHVFELCDLSDLIEQAGTEVAHPVGAAAALGTWIDVDPSSSLRNPAGTPAPDSSDVVVRARAVPAPGRRQWRTGATAEVDRGGP